MCVCGYIFQARSTCKIEENSDLENDYTSKWNVMNLELLTKSPYLKHPIWFLSTAKNSKCPITVELHSVRELEHNTTTNISTTHSISSLLVLPIHLIAFQIHYKYG